MKRTIKLLAALLALWMTASCLPLTAMAAETPFTPSKISADKTTLVGDVDKDGEVTQKDRLILTRYLAGWSSYGSSIKSEAAADINGDGKITAMDRLLLGRFLGQWEGYEMYFSGGENETSSIFAPEIEEEHIKEGILVYDGEEYEGTYIDNQLIVIVDTDMTDEDVIRLFEENVSIVGKIPNIGYYLVEFGKNKGYAELEVICSKLKETKKIENAYVNIVSEIEPNGEILSNGYENISFTFPQGNSISPDGEKKQYSKNTSLIWDGILDWHLRYTKIDKARKLIKNGSKINVGIFDTMFDDAHEDLPCFSQNYYIDQKWNYTTDDNIILINHDIINTSDPALYRHYAHGTHVAGIIGAKNDGKGVAGVADNISLYGFSLHRKNTDNFRLTIEITSFHKMSALAVLIEEKVRVINYSIAYPTPDEKKCKEEGEKIKEIIENYVEKGYDFLIVAGAGNLDNDAHYNSEFCYLNIDSKEMADRILIVSSAYPVYTGQFISDPENPGQPFDSEYVWPNPLEIEHYDTRMTDKIFFHSSHSSGSTVDILAPGYVLSTVPKTNVDGFSPTGYAVMSGTSMATPIVSGVAALLYSINPHFTAQKVHDLIISNSNHVDRTCDRSVTDRFLDAEAAVAAALGIEVDNQTYTVTGMVRDEAGSGMSGVTVKCKDSNGKFYPSSDDVITGSEDTPAGQYTISNLPAGQYTLTYELSGYGSKPVSVSVDTTKHEGISIAVEDVTMCKLYSFSGKVVDETGEPLKGVNIEPWDWENKHVNGTAGDRKTNKDGIYTFTGYIKGEYTLRNFALEGYSVISPENGILSVTLPGDIGKIDNVVMKKTTEEEDLGEINASGQCGPALYWRLFNDGLLEIYGEGAMSEYLIPPEGLDWTPRPAPWYEYRSQCTKLKIGNSVTTIGMYAFYDCTELSGELHIPDKVTSIGQYAFAYCGFTGDLIIPDSVKELAPAAFRSCQGFSGTLTLSESLTAIWQYTFCMCDGLTGPLTIPKSIQSIGEYAFYGCSNLTGILSIPNSVTSIGNCAFCYCSGFSGSLSIPEKVTSIGEYAFYGCSGITGNLKIPASVNEIGKQAFNKCEKISLSYFYGNEPKVVGVNIFGSRDSSFLVYHLADKSGWPAEGEEWNGYKTAIFTLN